MTRKIVIILTMVLVACLYLNTNQLLADNQQAEKFYQKGEEYYNLGIKYRSISRLKKAQKYFSQCAKIDPDYKSVKQHLSSLEEIIKLREENWGGLKIHKLEKRPLPHSIYEAKRQYNIKVKGGARRLPSSKPTASLLRFGNYQGIINL